MANWDGKSRPVNDAYRNNYDDIFNKKKKKETCPCGRSPIARCVGWHGLTEAEYQVKLSKWKEIYNV